MAQKCDIFWDISDETVERYAHRMLLRKTEEPKYKEIYCVHGWNSQYC